ncbi:MAG: hypothetical protein IIA05_11665 [Proteobacteria bacterium]|nr:hypothetical protein [Pseudomonadota bacterium]
MNIYRFVASILLGTVLWFGGYQPASAQGTCVATVDGSDPILSFDSIQTALDEGHIFISFTGICPSFNIFGINNVSITGDGTGAGATSVIDGAVLIFGATNVVLRNFMIKPVNSPASDVILLVFRGSYVGVINNIVLEGSLFLLRNAGAELRNTTITAPVGLGAVRVFRSSFLRLGAGNSIQATDSLAAVVIASDSNFIMRDDSTTQINGAPFALRVERGSLAEIRRGVITGDVVGDLHSVVSFGDPFQGGDVSVSGNLTIGRDSALVFEVPAGFGTVTFDGTVTCLDDESSVSGSPSGTGVFSCTGFDQVKSEKDKKK